MEKPLPSPKKKDSKNPTGTKSAEKPPPEPIKLENEGFLKAKCQETGKDYDQLYREGKILSNLNLAPNDMTFLTEAYKTTYKGHIDQQIQSLFDGIFNRAKQT